MKHFYLFILLALFVSCKNDHTTSDGGGYSNNYYEDEEGYNGTYCAEVEYYNPSTGTRSTYELDVEVENGYLVQIDWPNGGWLDETHFSSEDISSGECSFTSDRGYHYTVTLGDKGGGCYIDGARLQDDVNAEVENTTCPKCGDEKDEYDEYCYFCQRNMDREAEESAEDEY